jgi:hypothetical protein
VGGEQLPARDADAVVRRRHVEHVRRVDDDHDVGRQQVGLVGTRLGILVALRIGQEHLDAVGVHLGRAGQRTAVQEFVVVGETWADVHADRVNRHT